MKILYVSGFVPYPPISGNLQRNFNLIKELSKNNQIDLVTLTQRGLLPDNECLEEAIAELKKYCRSVVVFEIPVDYSKFKWYLYLFANLFSSTPFTVWKFNSKKMHQHIRVIAKKTDYDVAHFDSSDVAQYHFEGFPIPSLLNHHNIESNLLLRRSANMRNPLKKLYLYLQGKKLQNYERKIISRFALNIAVSEEDVAEIQKASPNIKTGIVANGTDTEYFKPNHGHEEKRLVFAGPLSWYPNADAMIFMCREIYPFIKSRIKDIQMDIIGHSAPKALMELAKADSSIHLHGFVDDIRPYLASASVYVVPIRAGGGTRLKILDAMACGKAVVSTSIGCEGLETRNGEDILIADPPKEFAESVYMLIEDQQLRKKLEANGRRLVEERYSWKMIGKRLESLYESIIRK